MFQKINQIAMFAFMAVGVILMVMTLGVDVQEGGICEDCAAIGWFLSLSYVLMFLAVLAAISGTVITALNNPRKLKGSAISIGIIVLLALVCYLLASDEVLESYGDITPMASKVSGAGLYLFYVLFLGAIGAIVYSSISRLIR